MPTDKQPDKLLLSGIKLFPHIGTTPEERATPQVCMADLAIRCNLAIAAVSDNLESSIDYCRVLERVKQIAVAKEYALVETLAYAIVDAIIKDFAVMDACIRIRKRPAVLHGELDFVEITVEKSAAVSRRERAQYYDFS